MTCEANAAEPLACSIAEPIPSCALRNDVQGYTARTLAFVLDNRSSHAHCAMTWELSAAAMLASALPKRTSHALCAMTFPAAN